MMLVYSTISMCRVAWLPLLSSGFWRVKQVLSHFLAAKKHAWGPCRCYLMALLLLFDSMSVPLREEYIADAYKSWII